MSDVMTATMTVGELAENFEFLGDWEERYRYIIDLGRELEPLPEDTRFAFESAPADEGDQAERPPVTPDRSGG